MLLLLGIMEYGKIEMYPYFNVYAIYIQEILSLSKMINEKPFLL